MDWDAKVAQLKKEAYDGRHPGDLFYMPTLKVFGSLYPIFDYFLQACPVLVHSGGLIPKFVS